jgi:acyl dehydratase
MQRRARMITPLAAYCPGPSFKPVLGYGLLCAALYLTAPGNVWGQRDKHHSPVGVGNRVEVSARAHGSRVQAARVRLIDAEGTAARTARSVG